LQKYFRSRLTQITGYIPPIPSRLSNYAEK